MCFCVKDFDGLAKGLNSNCVWQCLFENRRFQLEC